MGTLGSEIGDPITGEPHEGGHMIRWSGRILSAPRAP
jgi:hypothetical protein